VDCGIADYGIVVLWYCGIVDVLYFVFMHCTCLYFVLMILLVIDSFGLSNWLCDCVGVPYFGLDVPYSFSLILYGLVGLVILF